MFKELRQQRILEILKEKRAASVKELSNKFSVTKTTIRNDLKEIESNSSIKYTRGGAILKNSEINFEEEPSFTKRSMKFPEEKRKIGKEVSKLFANVKSFMIDDGTTNLMVAKELNKKPDLFIITNGFNIGKELAQNNENKVICCGGRINLDDNSVLDSYTVESVQKFNAKVAIIGASGIDKDGLTTMSLIKRDLKKAMISSCNKAVVVADGSKIGRRGLVKVSSLKKIDYLITSSTAREEKLKIIRENHPDLKLFVADE